VTRARSPERSRAPASPRRRRRRWAVPGRSEIRECSRDAYGSD
jgi:hypothetical protein